MFGLCVFSDSGHVTLHPSLFLLLLVLSRLYPSPMDGSSSPLGLAPFTPFIIRWLIDHHPHTRVQSDYYGSDHGGATVVGGGAGGGGGEGVSGLSSGMLC